MTTETAAKKDTQKLQRAIVDGLEDVKAQNVQVFNTEHLSPLFERVIVATGTSNRQTKALAASVRDAVREAGFPKPRIEGEENGEWIIVDCGAAVAHVMQPAIREYYHLEEIWGEKPVRLKLGADKPAVPSKVPAKKAAPKVDPDKATLRRSSAAKTAIKAAEAAAKEAKAPKAKPRTSGKAPARAPGRAPARSSAAAPAKSATSKPTVYKVPAKSAKAPAKAPAKSVSKAPAKAPAKSAPRKAPARKA
jgi:ribosome-associated protein